MTAIPETHDSGAIETGHSRTLIYLGVVAFMASFAVPMSFLYYVFPPMLRALGHGPEIVGAFAMVYLPYVLRGVWAFAIERLMKGQAARYRWATVVLAVLGVGGVLALLLIDPTRQVGATMGIAVVIFVLFSSGMTTLDGYLLATLSPEDRASSAAWTAGGVAFGGIAVGFMAWFEIFSGSWVSAVCALAIATLIPALFILILPKAKGLQIPEKEQADDPPKAGKLRQFFTAGPLRALIIMAVLAHGTIGLISGYLPILQVDAGLSIGEIGLFTAIGANVMGLVGAMLGGWILSRVGGWRTLAFVTVLLCLILLGATIFSQAMWGKSFAISLTAILMMAGYIYYVPYRALVLQACEGPGSVSRVAILSSFDMTISIIGMSVAGLVAVKLGLTLFFAVGAVLMLCAALYALKNVAQNEPYKQN